MIGYFILNIMFIYPLIFIIWSQFSIFISKLNLKKYGINSKIFSKIFNENNIDIILLDKTGTITEKNCEIE